MCGRYKSLSPAIPDDLAMLTREELVELLEKQEAFIEICRKDTRTAYHNSLADPSSSAKAFYALQQRMLAEAYDAGVRIADFLSPYNPSF